jgi:acyl-CoA synthetase (AMP-forming)/AMP-acid ligase II
MGARFVPGRDGARMYRTGDAGRWRADGQLEVSGRLDRQLKVNGFRVDPGEIENALAGHPGIAQVTVRPRRRAGPAAHRRGGGPLRAPGSARRPRGAAAR